MTTPQLWVNGSLAAPGALTLSALDHGVTVGDGVFETAKVVAGQPFALTRHHARLAHSAAGLGLSGLDFDRINEGITTVLEAAPLPFGRLRYSVTSGVGPAGSDRGDAPLSYIVTATPAARPPAAGVLHVVPWTRNETSAIVGLKTTSYAENVVALARAKEHGADEAVFANTRGELCECTGSNIFVVIGGEVFTPPTDSGLLAGITRELTLEWGRAAGIPMHEQALPLDVLDSAHEVFITSSTRDVLPIRQVDQRTMPTDWPITARLQAIFTERAIETIDP